MTAPARTRLAKAARPEPATRALLYTRVSHDRSGVARSPREQEAELRRYCDVMGWAVTDVVVDNDIGASRYSRKTRPGWAAVLARVAAGDVDILLVWEASRLTRDLEEYVGFAKTCRATGTRIAYNGTVYDLDDPDDEFRVTLDIGLGVRESGVLRKRLKRHTTATAAAGRPAGRLLFGYRRIYDAHRGQLIGQEAHPVTGPVVAELYERVANGESIKSLMRDLDARGIPPMGGGMWAHTSLRRVVTNPSYLGHRKHNGVVVVESAWPPLVDESLFNRVQGLLGDERRRNAQDNRAKHLLTGLVRCEVCQGRLTYRLPRQRNGPLYWCQRGGHVATGAGRLEAGVRRLVTQRLARPDALDVFAEPTVDVRGLGLEMKALTARLDAADAALEAGEMSPRAHGLVERKCAPRIHELGGLIAGARRGVPAPLVALAADDVAEVERRYDQLVTEHLAVARLVIREVLVDAELRRSPTRLARADMGLRFRWGGVGEVVEL